MQFQIGIYHEKFQPAQIQNGRPAATSDRQIFTLTRFTQHFFMYRSNNSSDELEIGKIRTETRSWRPKWPIIRRYFCNMRYIWKTRPDS